MLEDLALLLAASRLCSAAVKAALLAYEPFANSPGAAIIGSNGGSGFARGWEASSSSGMATNAGGAPGCADRLGNTCLISNWPCITPV